MKIQPISYGRPIRFPSYQNIFPGYTRCMPLRASAIPAIVAVSLVMAASCEADSYRCGRKIVRTGDSVAQLLRVCGEPRFKAGGSGKIEIGGVPKKVRVQRWHYQKGSRRLERIILIYKGKIAAIEVGGR